MKKLLFSFALAMCPLLIGAAEIRIVLSNVQRVDLAEFAKSVVAELQSAQVQQLLLQAAGGDGNSAQLLNESISALNGNSFKELRPGDQASIVFSVDGDDVKLRAAIGAYVSLRFGGFSSLMAKNIISIIPEINKSKSSSDDLSKDDDDLIWGMLVRRYSVELPERACQFFGMEKGASLIVDDRRCYIFDKGGNSLSGMQMADVRFVFDRQFLEVSVDGAEKYNDDWEQKGRWVDLASRYPELLVAGDFVTPNFTSWLPILAK